MLLLFLSSVWGLLGTAFAVSNPICSNAPYKELLALSTYAPAVSFCPTHFPLKACTSTHLVSSTIQSTVFSTSTSTKTTITGTSTVSQDSTIKTTETVTTTDPVVFDTVSTLTVLTTITLAARKRDHDVPFAARELRTTAKTTSTTSTLSKSITTSTKSLSTGNLVASIWSKLESEAESIISLACTCIETQPPCTTVTSTTFVLAVTTLPKVVTLTTKIEATTTISSVITDTITTITDVASISDVTATTTVTVSVPFYTEVGGPYSGCEFLDDSNTEATPYTDAADLNEAITFCEAFCTADPTCTFIFVQYVNSGATGAQSFWACYYTEDADGSFHFSESDLDCSQPPQDYGEAYAFQNARTGS